ncbi:MAG: hypothetical protein EB084_12920 [Proteobacteria bacterium]|nr:hypothetical protein [Pseudomonadota bacterium]
MSRPLPGPRTTSSSHRTTRSHDAHPACLPPCSTAVRYPAAAAGRRNRSGTASRRRPLLSLTLLLVAGVLLLGGKPVLANEDDAIAEAWRS